MAEQKPQSRVDEFILAEIDSVPHLEALLLVWNTRPRSWSPDEMARSLYVRRDIAVRILESLAQRGLIVEASESAKTYHCIPGEDESNRLLAEVDAAYRRELVRISSMIHSKAPAGVRDFARAFRFTKDKE